MQVVGEVRRRECFVCADDLRGRQIATAGKRRQSLEDALLVVEEELVAPVDHRAKRLLTWERGTRPAGQQAEPIVQTSGDLLDRERAGACRGELDGEREPVETSADVGDRCVVVV